ncbi:glycosyltransferase [Geminocystis sp. NIES-3709]|uniref:glycosyltransferase family 2 protein n=1 Tax=Geminocystis sp. NIES-3709 TaxID=1617448 RepID=UPI0005FCD32B|nr:glycosyltransferase [Geminocystis sp. NIES-3709]BAQ66180.1 probable glycosyl transferase [Geminocystis sp. NIES-3709]
MNSVCNLISIIIPCYNAERFLLDTLKSVFNQSFSNYEIILIDDGSTDNTAEIIKSYGNRVKAKFTSNRGASAARNLGTSLAKGAFIQYLDADDLLAPNTLEKRVNGLINSNADVAYTDWQKLEEQKDSTFKLGDIINRSIEDIHPNPEIALFTDFWCPPAALLYSRRIVDKIGFWNESLPIIQDARFLLDSGLFGGKFIHISDLGAYYRVHRCNSLSKRNKIDFSQDCLTNAYQVEDFWKNRGEITIEQKNALIKVYGNLARFFFEYDRQKFSEIMEKIYLINPNYIPSNPRALNLLSKWFGYEKAEEIALIYRKLKQKLFWFFDFEYDKLLVEVDKRQMAKGKS